MKTKLLITLGISTLLLFTACGDSESSTESVESQIKKKDFIYIVQHTSDCNVDNVKKNSVAFSNTLQVPRLLNPDTLIGTLVNKLVSCETYGRTHDSLTCEHWNFVNETVEKSCVIGFDFE